MTFAQFDDGYPDHPKIAVLSDAAYRAHSESICYCNKYLTDGYIPTTVALRLVRNRRKALAELCGGDPPLWNEASGGYEVRDYLQWNRSRAEVEQFLRTKRAAGRTSAQSRAATRAATPVLIGGDGSSSASASKQTGVPPRFDEFWAAYPLRKDRKNAERAFRDALKRADADAIIEGAKRYAADPGRKADKTKFAQGWLNADRWLDEPTPIVRDETIAERLARIDREAM